MGDCRDREMDREGDIVKKREYTEKINAARLLKMLNKKDPCAHCPAAPRFDGAESPLQWKNDACEVCRGFLDYDNFYCPCYFLGKEEAIKRAWLALEEKGYLD